MSNIVTFAPRQTETEGEPPDPHGEGEAVCISCHHEWVAVAPVGTVGLECPQCSSLKGVWKRFFYRGFGDGEFPHWQCRCGCGLFRITPRGVYCPNCGRAHRPFDEPKDRA